MRLLNPTALAWVAVALPIVALYVLRIRRRRQVVPTLMFWDRVFRETAPRSLWRRFRHWASLLLQLAFLALLVLALTDPVKSGASRAPTHWILVVDESASMKAADGTPTRFDQAREIAHRTVRAMRAQDQATIIAAAVEPTVACGRTYHQPTLHKAIDRLAPTDSPCALGQAMQLAGSLHAPDERRSVVLITDAPGVGQIGEERAGWLSVECCGASAPNIAITGFAVRPRSDNPLELQGILRIANFTEQRESVDVRLTRDGELFDAVSMDVEPGDEKLHTFQYVHTGGRVLRAELSKADALLSDNTAAAILPEINELHVVLVSEGNVFLESVLAAHPWLKVSKLSSERWAEGADRADILIFDEYVPETLPSKPTLFVHPARDSELWSLGEDLRNPLVSGVTDDADLLRHVNVRNCTLLSARSVTSRRQAKTLVASFEQPLLLSWPSDEPRRVLCAVDVKKGDLPLRTAFPILMQNTLGYLAGRSDEAVSAHQTGQTAVLAIRATDVTACDSTGRPVPLVFQDDRWRLGPILSAGVVEIHADGRTIPVAFNLADSVESNIRHGVTSRPAANTGRALTAAWSWPWWVVLTLMAIGLSTLEWGLHQRRRID